MPRFAGFSLITPDQKGWETTSNSRECPPLATAARDRSMSTMEGYSKTPPLSIQACRGPNHILVSRRSSMASLKARANKVLRSGRWTELHVHGLGAALGPAIVLAATLVQESGGKLTASTTTSTELLVDHANDTDERSRIRHNSAVHIALSTSG